MLESKAKRDAQLQAKKDVDEKRRIAAQGECRDLWLMYVIPHLFMYVTCYLLTYTHDYGP